MEEIDDDELSARDGLLDLAVRIAAQWRTGDSSVQDELEQIVATDEAAREQLLRAAQKIVQLAGMDQVSAGLAMGPSGLDPHVAHDINDAFKGVNALTQAVGRQQPKRIDAALAYLDTGWQAERPHDRRKTALGLMLMFLGQRMERALL